MDRASFLRSLNFLRPVASEVWDTATTDNNNDISIDMSGSTITPPTPSKSNAMVLFQEESMFVVSIEPTVSSDLAAVDNCESDGMRKKRGRDDDMLSTKQKDASTTIGPAFFHQDITIKETKSAKTADTVNDDDNMDVDDNTVTEQSNFKRQTNSDPSLCTFEAVIIKKLPSELGDETTPNDKNQQQQQQDTSELSNDTESKTLLFRFGGHFIFQVDESAILDVTYQPGDDDEEDNDTANNKDSSKEGEDKEKGSPPSKRQRNETGNGTAKDKTSSTKSTKVPPCLIISFSSCVLRVFSLKEDTKDDGNASGSNDTPNDKTSRIWGTLATVETTVENRLKNAQTVLLQQFDIEERKHNSQHTNWKMAPPGSGLSFHSWPKVFEDSSFHTNALHYKDLTFLKENWSVCLGKKQIIECPVEESTSPQKSGSPSKSGSSTFENGQKDSSLIKHNGASSSLSHSQSAPTENGASSSSKHESKDTGASSELSHESQNGRKDGDDTKAKPHPESQHSSQSLLSENDEDIDGNDSKLEAVEKNETEKENPQPDSQSSMSEDPKKLEAAKDAENNSQSETIDAKQPADDKDEQMASKEEGEEEEEADKGDDKGTEQKSWKVGLYKKYRNFESSAIHIEQAIEPTVGRQNEESLSNLLTNCAESLASSYLTANEFMDASQQCENEIEKTTSEMEKVLDTMFPARGKKKNVVTSDQSEDLQQRIEDLMASRRETVAAKLALLMIPKK